MAEYLDGVGAWGAWQVEPSKFTQLVVDSMRTLYVSTLPLDLVHDHHQLLRFSMAN